MKIIISPAKQMKICEDDLLPLSTPRFLDKAAYLLHQLQSKSYEELKKSKGEWSYSMFDMEKKAPTEETIKKMEQIDGVVRVRVL